MFVVIIFFCNNTKTRFLLNFHIFHVNIIVNKKEIIFYLINLCKDIKLFYFL